MLMEPVEWELEDVLLVAELVTDSADVTGKLVVFEEAGMFWVRAGGGL